MSDATIHPIRPSVDASEPATFEEVLADSDGRIFDVLKRYSAAGETYRDWLVDRGWDPGVAETLASRAVGDLSARFVEGLRRP